MTTLPPSSVRSIHLPITYSLLPAKSVLVPGAEDCGLASIFMVKTRFFFKLFLATAMCFPLLRISSILSAPLGKLYSTNLILLLCLCSSARFGTFFLIFNMLLYPFLVPMSSFKSLKQKAPAQSTLMVGVFQNSKLFLPFSFNSLQISTIVSNQVYHGPKSSLVVSSQLYLKNSPPTKTLLKLAARVGHEKRRRKAGLLYKCHHLNTISVRYYQKVNRVKEKRSCPLAIQRRSSAPQVLSLGYPVTPYHILVFYSSSRDFVKKTTPQHSLINLVLGLTPSLQQKIRPL